MMAAAPVVDSSIGSVPLRPPASRLTAAACAVAGATAVGLVLLRWRQRNVQNQNQKRPTLLEKSVHFAADDAVAHKFSDAARAEEAGHCGRGQEEENLEDDFSVEAEEQQCDLSIDVATRLEAASTSAGATGEALGEQLRRSVQMLQEYRQHLADAAWLARRRRLASRQLGRASTALEAWLLADDEKDLESAARRGRDIPELREVIDALADVMKEVDGNGSAARGGCGNGSSGCCGGSKGSGACGGAKAQQSSGGCCGGAKAQQTSGGCCGGGRCTDSAPAVRVAPNGSLRLDTDTA
eukprot:TRINITY_DN26273_c0_g1_i1.p1 TRINITY_DN26273_c0_g1~~TRINITY_DN26273_c0_g1_i1.p1  ORF type:complete len:297 (+),score=87.73 TRINITY_DN26273_c0_g1_i1:58-948(+)